MSTRRIALVVIALAPGMAAAQGLERASGAREIGLAGATAAAGPSGESLWSNPAALGSGRVLVALSLHDLDLSVERGAGERITDLSGPQLTPAASGTFELLEGRLSVALGYRLTWRNSVSFSTAEVGVRLHPIRYVGYRLRTAEHAFAFALAGRFRRFSIGAAVEAGVARAEIGRSLWSGSATDIEAGRFADPSYDLGVELEGVGFGLTGRAGVTVQPWSWLRIGLVVEMPWTARVKGDARLELPDSPPAGSAALTPASESTPGVVRLDRPPRLKLGFALAPLPRLRLLWQLDLLLPGDGGALRFPGSELSLERANETERRSLPQMTLAPEANTSLSIRAGVEARLLGGACSLRAGWAFHRSATEEALRSLLVDFDRHQIAGGVKITVERLTLALAVEHIFAADLIAGEIAPLNPVEPIASEPLVGGKLSASRTQVVLQLELSY